MTKLNSFCVNVISSKNTRFDLEETQSIQFANLIRPIVHQFCLFWRSICVIANANEIIQDLKVICPCRLTLELRLGHNYLNATLLGF